MGLISECFSRLVYNFIEESSDISTSMTPVCGKEVPQSWTETITKFKGGTDYEAHFKSWSLQMIALCICLKGKKSGSHSLQTSRQLWFLTLTACILQAIIIFWKKLKLTKVVVFWMADYQSFYWQNLNSAKSFEFGFPVCIFVISIYCRMFHVLEVFIIGGECWWLWENKGPWKLLVKLMQERFKLHASTNTPRVNGSPGGLSSSIKENRWSPLETSYVKGSKLEVFVTADILREMVAAADLLESFYHAAVFRVIAHSYAHLISKVNPLNGVIAFGEIEVKLEPDCSLANSLEMALLEFIYFLKICSKNTSKHHYFQLQVLCQLLDSYFEVLQLEDKLEIMREGVVMIEWFHKGKMVFSVKGRSGIT